MIPEIQSLPAYQAILEDLRANRSLPDLMLPRAARLPVSAALYRDFNQPVLILTDRADHALALLDELGFWLPEITRLAFPEPNSLFYEPAAWGSNTRRDRLEVLTALAAYHQPGARPLASPPIIIASVRAVMTRTLPRRDFLKVTRVLKPGVQVSPESLRRTWVEIGYQPADTVLEPGQFSQRGGILDIWPSGEPLPARLDFFGDDLETIRRFDPATQRTVKSLDQLLLCPARELLPGKAAALGLQGEDVNEFYLPMVHSMPASLLDYLPRQTLVLIDDLDLMQSAANEIEEQAVRLRAESIREGTLPAEFPIPYLSWSELFDCLTGHSWVNLGRMEEIEPSALAQCFQLGQRYGGRIKPVLDELVRLLLKGDRFWVVSRQISRLQELWQERVQTDPVDCSPEFHEGTLSEGFILTQPGGRRIFLLSDAEIFGWERPQPRPRHTTHAEAPESSYTDLKAGDWVVHVDYGIGRYVGLVRRSLEGSDREFLCVEYEGGDQIFVPVFQADRLSRYIGPDAGPPSLTRLGSGEWHRAKEQVKEAVQEVAQELLNLYAKRQVSEGHAYPPDTPWQQELEASFPYIETDDQLNAIRDVKKDMEAARPMDRLLCGDVGYGKTEVALRAAFKAVMDGKQVAVLVPTTVLAQQHFETFRQRLAAYPVQVEMLSRFRTPKEQDEILLRLALGEMDIVIGTHRLISNDVEFKDLGLVIIDEEQRFGVTHKEHFKKLRTEVDVLTLTATPIPRTLYMALTGVRDISTINTPPAERVPISTHIGPYSPPLVRQSILRELERGGQVFFVHNRVQTIHGMQQHLNHLVPEARVGVAHGQMHETELAAVMQQFTHGEIDVLLCTSIIESGLDIPNANTLIVDRGDTFGLAQLYQLRGRVGRGAQRAYAYFFRHRKKSPTPEGLERLEVIAENTQLGAGYSIAMRDLEMRGAGDLLGMRQHGFIASVGFHLYTRMLAQAVRTMKKIHSEITGLPEMPDRAEELTEILMPVTVDLPLAIEIPVGYIAEQNMRLQLYRRLANARQLDDLKSMRTEFTDRFGKMPFMLENLFFQIEVKLRAERAGLSAVALEGDQIVLRYTPLPEGASPRILPSVPQVRTGKNAYWLPIEGLSEAEWRQRLLDTLSAIMSV